MKVFGREWLDAAKEKYRDAAKEIDRWFKAVENAQWKHPMDMTQTFKDADTVDGQVIFNIRRNRYRLVTVIRYPQEIVFVRSFLTHKQYNNRSNWDKGVL